MTRIILDPLGDNVEVDVPNTYFGTEHPDSELIVPSGFQISRTRSGKRTIRTLIPINGATASTSITMPGSIWAFGSSSMMGGQIATASSGGTEDSLTNVVRAIEGLAAGSSAYTTVSGSQTTRTIDYNLTGANSAHKVRNRGVGGQTTGSGGTIVTTMNAAAGSFGASDFMVLHQGDNSLVAPMVEQLAGGYAAMRTTAGARTFVQIVNTKGGGGSAGAAAGESPGGGISAAKAVALRILNDINPGTAFSFHDVLVERSTAVDANDTADIGKGWPPRSHMMNDGSHQIATGYNLQSNAVLTPLIDAWAGGTPFPLKQVIEAVAPASPAGGNVVGSIVAYGSGGSFALDASNTQTTYAVSTSGQITRVGATLPARDITWMPVRTSKNGRLNKVQPQIGVCERAASGVSKMVEFDGASIIAMDSSKLANSAKMTLLFRLQSTDQTIIQNLFGSTGQLLIRVLTTGALDIVLRNAGGSVIYSKTTAANFRTVDPVRWVAISLNLSNPAAEVSQLVTWAVPATATTDSAVHSGLTADTTTTHLARLDTALAIGHSSSAATAGTVFAKLRLGDVTLWRDYIDFTVQATREIVSNADGSPASAWVASGGVVSSKTPDLRLAGNAGDFRRCRLTGNAAPATPGASGQYLGFTNNRRGDGEAGYLVTVP